MRVWEKFISIKDLMRMTYVIVKIRTWADVKGKRERWILKKRVCGENKKTRRKEKRETYPEEGEERKRGDN